MIWLLAAAAAVVGGIIASMQPGGIGGTIARAECAVGIGPQSGVASNLQQAQQAGSQGASQMQQQSNQGGMAVIGSEIGLAGTTATSGIGLTAAAEAGTLGPLGIATAGIGVAIGLAAVLWARHEQRVKDATNENSAWNVIYPAWASSIQQIMSAYNTGEIDAPTTAAEFTQLRTLVFQDAVKFQGQPGIDWSGGNSGPGGQPVGSGTSQKIWQVQCGKSCTIGCCLYNSVVGPNTNRAIALVTGQQVMLADGLMHSTNAFQVPALPMNPTFGFQAQPAFVLAVNAA